MSTAHILIVGEDVLCRHPQIGDYRLDGATCLPQLQAWAERYEKAVQRNDELVLLEIGRAMYGVLNAAGWGEQWRNLPGARQLEIVVVDSSTPLASALLDAPWELLADESGHFADEGIQLYELARRIGTAQAPYLPQYSDLQVMFMAAAPQGEHVLDYESEESAILATTERLPLHLLVEESGNLQFLGERLAQENSCEVLHLSCHGDIDPVRGPVLALEDECGKLQAVTCADLVREISPERTPLVFLSACRTAEQGEHRQRAGEPMARAMIRAGFAHAIGWDGSVYDNDARLFAEAFYARLLKQGNAVHACAQARQQLRLAMQRQPEAPQGQHWHLARLYVGPRGGGPLLSPKLGKRPPLPSGKQFLDQERRAVPVAGRHQFVGRRRILQDIFSHVRRRAPGVLLYGMGNLGKSSIAYRVSTRLNQPTAVVFGKYDAEWIFERLVELLPPAEREAYRETWQRSIRKDPAHLAEAIEALLTGPGAGRPILLIIDDLEQILDAPGQAQALCTVKPAYRSTLAAVIQGFEKANSDSALLFTSRYLFTLPDRRDGQDLGAKLAAVPLQPMDNREQKKQLLAAARQVNATELEVKAVAEPLKRALALAQGNPGLQTLLTHPLLRGEQAAAASAMAAIEHYLRHGVPPEVLQQALASGSASDRENATLEFFKRMAFERYRSALSADEVQFLRCSKLFRSGVAVPELALIAVARSAGIARPEQCLRRLQALGLLDTWPKETPPASACNPLARPLVGEVDEPDSPRFAAAALEVINTAWRDEEGNYPRNIRALEACHLALQATPCPAAWLNDSANAAARFLDAQGECAEAWVTILLPALNKLEQQQENPSHTLLLIAIDCAQILGETSHLADWLEMLQATAQTEEELAGSALYRGRRQQSLGHPEEAFKLFEVAREKFTAAGRLREAAIATGYQADIHQARGQLDQALRIRLEEQLPVFEKLGDVRERAVTLGKIADIHQARGQFDLARKLHEERWPIACQLGDIDSQAHILFMKSRLTLKADGLSAKNAQGLHDDLAQAWRLSQQLQRPDFIGAIGLVLCQVLAAGGAIDLASQVLDEAEAAWQQLENSDALQQVSHLREQFLSLAEQS